jgi:hypothetical protein
MDEDKEEEDILFAQLPSQALAGTFSPNPVLISGA